MNERQRINYNEVDENVIVKLFFVRNRQFRSQPFVKATNRQNRVHQQVGNAHVGRFPIRVLLSEVENENERGESESTRQNE